MKISKLFHWLYAFLMLLPVFALLPSVFYFAFNQESANYTDVEVNETYEYETNEVNSVDDLIVGNIYHLKLENYSTADNFWLETELIYNSDFNNLAVEVTAMSWRGIRTISDRLYIVGLYQIQDLNISSGSNYVGYRSNLSVNFDIELDFVYTNLNTSDSNFITYISASDYLGEKNVEVIESEQSPQNIFYTAVNAVYEQPMFAWAKTSFLVAPFAYIGGLFGVPATSPITYYLSYWLAISIIYLVFDLVMYVPLLCHRWIDKGVIE